MRLHNIHIVLEYINRNLKLLLELKVLCHVFSIYGTEHNRWLKKIHTENDHGNNNTATL